MVSVIGGDCTSVLLADFLQAFGLLSVMVTEYVPAGFEMVIDVSPVLQRYEYPDVPPETVAVSTPLPPVQITGAVTLRFSADCSTTVIHELITHPPASVTCTQREPAAAVVVVAVDPVDHK